MLLRRFRVNLGAPSFRKKATSKCYLYRSRRQHYDNNSGTSTDTRTVNQQSLIMLREEAHPPPTQTPKIIEGKNYLAYVRDAVDVAAGVGRSSWSSLLKRRRRPLVEATTRTLCYNDRRACGLFCVYVDTGDVSGTLRRRPQRVIYFRWQVRLA